MRFVTMTRWMIVVAAFLCTPPIACTSESTGNPAAKPGKDNRNTTTETSAPYSGSWPSFRNGNQLHGIATSTLPQDLQLLWKHPAPDGIASTAAIVDGRVYIGTLSGEVFCLELKSGREIWNYRSIDDPQEDFAPGFLSSPTVTAEAVFLGDEFGVFHALDRETGKKKWTFPTDSEIISSAAIVDDRVIFGSYDSNLYCLKTEDGSQVWKFQTQDRVNCSPAIAAGHTFVTGCDQFLRVVDIQSGEQKGEMPLESYLIASPAVMGDLLYVGTHGSEVLAVNWQKQEIVWRYRNPKRDLPFNSSAAITEDYVFVGGQDKQLHCIDRQTGDGVWMFPTRGPIDSSPVVVRDHVFVGSGDGHVYGVNLKTGKQVWKEKIGRNITASPAVGDGCLVIGAEMSNGFLYCFGER